MAETTLDFDEERRSSDEPATRAELLLLSPSFLVPCLHHAGLPVWDTLAIAEYLAELFPESRLLPDERAARARCRSVCGEMHAGFGNMRSALPMNLKGNIRLQSVGRRTNRYRSDRDDMARMSRVFRRSVSLRSTRHGRCEVRTGRYAVSHVSRPAVRSFRGVLRPNYGLTGGARMDRSCESGAGRSGGTRGRILAASFAAIACARG